jgi:hypothetical protein
VRNESWTPTSLLLIHQNSASSQASLCAAV